MFEAISSFVIGNPLIELGIVSFILMMSGYAAKLLKQPILVGYIIAGILIGPQFLDVIHYEGNIALYAHFGISLLLFMVGLGLNPTIIKEVGKVSLVAGIGQVVFTSIIGFLISLLMGFDVINSLFLAIALTFSSTIIIIKLITDKGDAGTFYGKVSLGVLIVQDIIAMLLLLIISSLGADSLGDSSLILYIVEILVKIGGLILFTRLMARYVLPPLTRSLAKEKELLLLFTITRAILLGAAWYAAGFSMEIGALLAGVTLASSRYKFHIFSELRPFRDFFLALFFVYLGGQIIFDSIGSLLFPIILFSLFVLAGNPFIVVVLMKKLGHSSKDSFMTGLTVAQISEFSFIVIGLALSSGLIEDPNILALVTIVGLITMMGSSYLFAYADQLYRYVKPFIEKLSSKKHSAEGLPSTPSSRVVVVGYGRLGSYIASKLKEHQISFCIIENNQQKIDLAKKKGYTVIYGDFGDQDIIEQTISSETEVVYSTIPDHDTSIFVLSAIKSLFDEVTVIVTALYLEETEGLYENGADYVIFPHLAGAHESRDILEKHVWSPDEFIIKKAHHIDTLQTHKSYID